MHGFVSRQHHVLQYVDIAFKVKVLNNVVIALKKLSTMII